MREAINADILEIKPKNEINSKSSMKYFWGGYQATMKRKPRLNPLAINPLEYDLIIIGTPVWAWTLSPPIRSFLSKFDFSGKKIGLWMCSAGDPKKAIIRFKDELRDANIIGDINFRDPLINTPEKNREKAITWVKTMAEQYS